jgi:hypothetical protein
LKALGEVSDAHGALRLKRVKDLAVAINSEGA